MCSTRHWDNDRTDDLVMEYADDGIMIEGMKIWLGLDENVPVDESRLEKAFEALDWDTQVAILEDCIEECGLKSEFDEWYEDKYGDDEDDEDRRNDWRGERDDYEYERYRDEQLEEEYLRDAVNDVLGIDEVNAALDKMCDIWREKE